MGRGGDEKGGGIRRKEMKKGEMEGGNKGRKLGTIDGWIDGWVKGMIEVKEGTMEVKERREEGLIDESE